MKNLIYEHLPQVHRTEDPRVVIPVLLKNYKPKSVVDFGAGLGTWLYVFQKAGIVDYVGIEHPEVDLDHYIADRTKLIRKSLSETIDLGRKFDLAVCIEVAEHLQPGKADQLVDNIIRHSDNILWSAAVPGQKGINHFNEQYPYYWQKKFRQRGYYFHDVIRESIQKADIFPCYKNNIFLVNRKEGGEWNGKDCILPALWEAKQEEHARALEAIEQGSRSVQWYLSIGIRGIWAKAKRRIKKNKNQKQQF